MARYLFPMLLATGLIASSAASALPAATRANADAGAACAGLRLPSEPRSGSVNERRRVAADV